MTLDSVTKEIEAFAQASAAKLREEQAAEIEDINDQADAQIAEMKEKQEKRISEAKEILDRQERSSADLESKKLILAKKKEILDRAFESALSELESMPAEKKKAYYQAIVKAAKDIIPEPKALISAGDAFTAEDLGVRAVEKDSKIRSGLILQSADGALEVDMQYSVLLQNIWDSNLKQLSGILFG